MQIIVNPEKREWAALTARPQMERSTIGPRVAAILDAVRAEGDDALLRLTREIDGVKLSSPAVTADEIEEASRLVPQELKTAIATAKNNIERFHAAQQGEGVDLETMPGVRCVLGVSNISFGLPFRPLVNATFLAAALSAGLDLAIINPESRRMMDVVESWRVLSGEDEQARFYVEHYAGR